MINVVKDIMEGPKRRRGRTQNRRDHQAAVASDAYDVIGAEPFKNIAKTNHEIKCILMLKTSNLKKLPKPEVF